MTNTLQKPKTALFIGRFQPFHKGHLEVIKRISKEYALIKIAIGSSQESHTQKNPFSVEERKTMIELTLENQGITNYEIYEVSDINDNNKWVSHTIKFTGTIDVVVTGNDLVKSLFEQAHYSTAWINERYFGIVADEIRKRIHEHREWKQFVDPIVYELIQKLDGEERIKHMEL